GFAPRTPLHARSRGPPSPSSACVGSLARSFALCSDPVLTASVSFQFPAALSERLGSSESKGGPGSRYDDRMVEQHFLDDAVRQLRKLKQQAYKALAQTSDPDFFATLDSEANSIALIMKHVAGNMRSRWTDFLTTDGEKPDRDRDREFETTSADTRASVTAQWEDGWNGLFAAITPLLPGDLSRTVHVRGEAHSVLEA